MKILCCALMAFFSITTAHAQVLKDLGGQRAGISGLSFLKMEVSPKSDAMGGAQLTAHGDPYATNWNPAGLTELTQTSFAASDKLLPGGVHSSFLSGVFPTENNGIWGGSITMLSTGEMKKRTAYQPKGTGETFSAYNMAVGLSFSRRLSDRFSLGSRVQYVREQLAEFSANTAVVDLAFMYQMDVQDIRFAVALKNFGPNSTIDGPFDKTPPPVNGNQNNLSEFPTPTQFQMGVSMRIFENGNQLMRGHLQLNHPNDNSENLRLGVNYHLNQVLFVRTGYKVPNDEQPLPTAGIGLKTHVGRHPLQVDYGIVNRKYFGMMHNLGLNFKISNQTR